MSFATSSSGLSNKNSCAGYIFIFSRFSKDLCVLISNVLIESISSPHSSIRIPCFSEIATSIMPPLTLNSDLFSTTSCLSYPSSTSFCFISSRLITSPILSSNIFLYSTSSGIIFWLTASIVVTIILACFLCISFKHAILLYVISLLSAK